MKRSLGWITVCVCSSLLGCGSKDLSRSKAAHLIGKNDVFSSTSYETIPVGNVWWDVRSINADLKVLQASNVLAVRETGQKNGYFNKEYLLELTPHGKDLVKTWTPTNQKMPSRASYMGDRCWTTFGTGGEPCHEATGVVYTVVTARRKLDEVSGILPDQIGGVSTAEFDWEWVPTDAAKQFTDAMPSAGVKKGKAAFQLYDDGWRLMNIHLNQ